MATEDSKDYTTVIWFSIVLIISLTAICYALFSKPKEKVLIKEITIKYYNV
jgi:hypothetical protein